MLAPDYVKHLLEDSASHFSIGKLTARFATKKKKKKRLTYILQTSASAMMQLQTAADEVSSSPQKNTLLYVLYLVYKVQIYAAFHMMQFLPALLKSSSTTSGSLSNFSDFLLLVFTLLKSGL